MPNWKNIAIGTGIGAGLIGSAFGIRKLISYTRSMTAMQAQLETVVTANIHSLTLKGLTVRVDAKLKNPTSGTMTLKFPFVKILYNDSLLGSSQVVNQDVILPKHGEAAFDGIMVNIPVTGMLTLAGAIADLLVKKKEVPVFVKVITPIDLGWKKYTDEKTHKINLKPLAT